MQIANVLAGSKPPLKTNQIVWLLAVEIIYFFNKLSNSMFDCIDKEIEQHTCECGSSDDMVDSLSGPKATTRYTFKERGQLTAVACDSCHRCAGTLTLSPINMANLSSGGGVRNAVAPKTISQGEAERASRSGTVPSWSQQIQKNVSGKERK